MYQPTHILYVIGCLVLLVASLDFTVAFAPPTSSLSPRVSTSTFTSSSSPYCTNLYTANNNRWSSRLYKSRVIFADEDTMIDDKTIARFDPLGYSSDVSWEDNTIIDCKTINSDETSPLKTAATTSLALSTILINPENSYAAFTKLSEGDYNPDTFRPVCSASDSFYRFLQGSTRAVVGTENFSEYGPLIAGGLLRIRLELCVVESFFNEAVGPFIKENGLNWILPWHETVETFIAGTIFALATTFILVGSTKLIQVISFYGDLVFGGPCRLFGGFLFDRARGKPVTLDVSFFGFFKTRLVGPPTDFKDEEKGSKEPLLDFENVKPVEVPILVLSGGVKLVGEASKVSYLI